MTERKLKVDELMSRNIVLYNGKYFRVLLIATAETFIEPIEGVDKDNPHIRCYIYQIAPARITAEIWAQLPDDLPLNEVPSWIEFVHELQNWYYWNKGKKELVLNF